MKYSYSVGHYAIPNQIRHDFYVTGDIGEADDYLGMFQTLATASPMDVIYIHLNTHGGDFYTACQIAVEIQRSNAGAIIACADGLVASAGTIIFLACDNWVVSEFSQFLFHTSSGGSYGKLPDSKKSILAHEEHINRVSSIIYQPFFDAEEIDSIINKNQDYWLTPDQVLDRLEVVNAAYQAEETKILDQVKAAQDIVTKSGSNVKLMVK